MTDGEYPAGADPNPIDASTEHEHEFVEILVHVLGDIEAILTRVNPNTRAEIDTILAQVGNTGGTALLIDEVQLAQRDLRSRTASTDLRLDLGPSQHQAHQ